MYNNNFKGLGFPYESIFYKAPEFNNAKQKEKEKFLTRKETAELCRVKSLVTLWNWSKKGILVPALQSGRKPLYRKSDVINFLEGKGGVLNDR